MQLAAYTCGAVYGTSCTMSVYDKADETNMSRNPAVEKGIF
jgi:hypothetical protein